MKLSTSYALTTLVVAAGLSAGFAGTAEASCTSVAGNGVCTTGYTPYPNVGSGTPVPAPFEICVAGDCTAQGEDIVTVPSVENEGGELFCVQLAGNCSLRVTVPDL